METANRRTLRWLTLALLGTVLAAFWLLAPSQEVRPPPHATTTPVRDTVAAELEREDSLAGQQRSTVLPDAPAAPAPPTSTEPDSRWYEAVIRGRCVADESGLPLAGCTIRATSVSTQADRDGRFELRIDPSSGRDDEVEIRGDGRVSRVSKLGSVTRGQEDDLGEIRLVRGIHVTGTVSEVDGSPVAKVEVLLVKNPEHIARVHELSNRVDGSSDASGRFTIGEPVACGTWHVRVSTRAWDLVEPEKLVVTEGSADLVLPITVRARRRISGHLVDETGEPVSGAMLQVRRSAEGERSTIDDPSWTDEKGCFEIHASDGDPELVQIENVGPGGPLHDDRRFAWGTTDVRLVLARGGKLWLTVREAGTQKPVEDFSVSCHAREGSWSNECAPRAAGHHPGGHVTVDRVRAGANVLRVLPDDPALAMIEEVSFEATDAGAAPLTVDLTRLQPLVVQVVRAGSKDPVAGTEVDLVKARGCEVSLDPHDVEPRADGSGLPLLMSSATTDQDGIATLHGPAEARDLVLRVLGPGHVPCLRREIALPQTDRLLVEVSQGGSVRAAITGGAPSRIGVRYGRITSSGEDA